MAIVLMAVSSVFLINLQVHSQPADGTSWYLSFQGDMSEHEGFAAWNADGSGPEPFGLGHIPPHPNYPNYYYYAASADYGDIDSDLEGEELRLVGQITYSNVIILGSGRDGDFYNVSFYLEKGFPELPYQGLASDHEGGVGWQADGSGPEPEGYGHIAPGFTAVPYYASSRDYDNIDLDPEFCLPEEYNFYLNFYSPCFMAGMNGTHIGAYGSCITAIPESAPGENAFSIYPNPLYGETATLDLQMKKESMVNVSVYNYLGQKVGEWLNGNLNAGGHRIAVNTALLAPGTYFIRLTNGNDNSSFKLVKIR